MTTRAIIRRKPAFSPFAIGALLALALAGAPAAAQTAAPTVVAVPGKPNLLIGAYDLGALGDQRAEYFLSGTATSYALAGPATADGVWNPAPAATAPYTTRVVVIRPSDPARFNGTVLVEWLNVTAGQDTPADWMIAHREIMRRGYAYVAVSAQSVGIEGGTSIMGMGVPLKKADLARYGTLHHPGDAFSYDIFSQAGAAVKAAAVNGLLGGLRPRHVLAIGESQSAAFLTTYVNAIDPIARVYDGFLIHSRFGGGSGLDGTRMTSAAGAIPAQVRFRPDLRVPLLTFITETDLMGGRLPGYLGSRRADGAMLRVWEMPGAAHADNYLFSGAFIDDGSRTADQLAKVFWPTTASMAGKMDKPFNPGMVQHYGVEAAIAALDHWVVTGTPPASTPRMELVAFENGAPQTLAQDANGLSRGGVRTPWVDVPVMRLSGLGNSGSFTAALVGTAEPFDHATLMRLYPSGKAEYLRRFTGALDRAIAAGHILAEDRQEILDVAAVNFDKAW